MKLFALLLLVAAFAAVEAAAPGDVCTVLLEIRWTLASFFSVCLGQHLPSVSETDVHITVVARKPAFVLQTPFFLHRLFALHNGCTNLHEQIHAFYNFNMGMHCAGLPGLPDGGPGGPTCNTGEHLAPVAQIAVRQLRLLKTGDGKSLEREEE
jgi:hypothetical protein